MTAKEISVAGWQAGAESEAVVPVGAALARAFEAGKPALVNVLTDPDVVYPRRSNLA